MHSFVEELWAEWLTFPSDDGDSASQEAAGLVAGLGFRGTVALAGGEFVKLACSRLWVLRRLIRVWKGTRWMERWNAANGVEVPPSLKGRVAFALPREIYEELAAFPAKKNWSWGRGLWGACGALYVPKSGYYMVMRVTDPRASASMGTLLSRSRIAWSQRTVHGTLEMILRDQQDIVAFLSKIGLSGISLRMEDKAILRAMRDQANRMRNCDTANIKKSLKVAEEQSALALRLKKDGILEKLPPSLRALAEARMENPEASLSELGLALQPSITKSTVKYRWKRLCAFVGQVPE